MDQLQFPGENNKKILSALLIVLTLFLAAFVVLKILDIKTKLETGRSTISVSDTGTVYVKPDLAISNFSVVTEGKTVAEALGENTKKMNAVIDAVKKLGVEEKDLKTTNFNISPHYEWPTPIPFSESVSVDKRTLVGYDVNQSLEIKIRNLEKVGEIIQAATAAGANAAGDLQFTVENQDAVKEQARLEAINKAKTKAQNLAKQLGVGLGRVLYFNESGSFPYYFTMEKAMDTGGGGAVPAPEIQTGENKIEVTVTITYEIR